MNEIKCIFCETESDHVVIEENGYKGKKCAQCGLIYISPRPSLDIIFDLYGHDNAHISAELHFANDFAARLCARHHLRIIRSFIKSGALLDIGAGAGYFLDEARKIGFNPYALEFNPVQANFIRNILNIPCEESPLNTSLFERKKFDAVYHCDVISHFFDPIAEFRKIHEIMKDDSFLIFETGNYGDVNQRYFKLIQKYQYPEHLFFFSTDNLIDLLERSGFKLIKLYRYSILPQLISIKILLGLYNLIKKYVLKNSEKEKYSSCNNSVGNLSDVNSQSFNSKSIVRNRIIFIKYQYINYVLRYKIGRIAPKAHRPQTVIVVAKKKSG
jgi:SAM-dependent methyltransferase